MTEHYLNYELNIEDRKGDPCCSVVKLRKDGVIIRDFRLNNIFVAPLVARWKSGIDALERVGEYA